MESTVNLSFQEASPSSRQPVGVSGRGFGWAVCFRPSSSPHFSLHRDHCDWNLVIFISFCKSAIILLRIRSFKRDYYGVICWLSIENINSSFLSMESSRAPQNFRVTTCLNWKWKILATTTSWGTNYLGSWIMIVNSSITGVHQPVFRFILLSNIVVG